MKTVSVVVSLGLAFLTLAAAAVASIIISLYIGQHSRQQICDGFGLFARPPSVQHGSSLYNRQEQIYQNLLKFERKVGCNATE